MRASRRSGRDDVRRARLGRGSRVGQSARARRIPLSKQIQRYALFVTLTRYDSALAHQPTWRGVAVERRRRRQLVLSLVTVSRGTTASPTTARDAVFTLLAAKDPATGYPRASELATLDTAVALNDTTLVLHFAAPRADLPAYLAELPLVPAHRLAGVPRRRCATAPFNDAPVGNGPFVFAARRRGARWSFVRNERFPAVLGGPPSLRGSDDRRRRRGDDEVRRPRER